MDRKWDNNEQFEATGTIRYAVYMDEQLNYGNRREETDESKQAPLEAMAKRVVGSSER